MAIPFKKYLQEATVYKGGRPRPDDSGRDIIKLSSNENQFGPSPKAMEAIKNHLEDLHEYPDPDDRRLSRALSQYYRGKLAEDQFFCAPSGSEIIEIICRGFLEREDEVIVCSPTFTPFIVFSEKAGGRVLDIPLCGPDFHFNEKKVLGAITPRTKIIFLASPNNPLGNYLSYREIKSLLEQLPDQVVLVLDEVYHHFADAPDYTRALDFVNMGKNIIGLNSFSKVYGLAGLRLGYGYSTPAIAAYLRLLCKPFALSTLAIEAGIAALSDTCFVSHTVENNHREKRYLYQQFEDLGIKYWPTQANFILIKPGCDEHFFEQQMLEMGIMVRPTGKFGIRDGIRVTIGRHEQNRHFVHALQQ